MKMKLIILSAPSFKVSLRLGLWDHPVDVMLSSYWCFVDQQLCFLSGTRNINTLRLSPSKLPILLFISMYVQFCPKGLIHLQEHMTLCFLFAAWWDQNHLIHLRIFGLFDGSLLHDDVVAQCGPTVSLRTMKGASTFSWGTPGSQRQLCSSVFFPQTRASAWAFLGRAPQRFIPTTKV